MSPVLHILNRHLGAWLAVPAVLAAAAAARADTALLGNSPFALSANAGGAAPGSANEPYELAGSSVQGGAALVCIIDHSAKHSLWIPVGETANGIHVDSFDADRDRAVVTVAGTRRELSLRKAATGPARALPTGVNPSPQVAFTPPPPPAAQPAQLPQAPHEPAPKTEAEHEQQEARMLVSDLLEIGMQQRKAYQEAKQKAATPPPNN